MNFFNQHNDLKDQLFCMREERNFFQSKYTEQVKEIESLKRQLELASNEILRLRRQVMQQRNETDDHAEEEKKTDGVERKQDEDEEEAIRRKASSLLQWAEYRENSPGKSALLYELNDEDEEHEEEDSFDEDEKEQDEVVPPQRVVSVDGRQWGSLLKSICF